MAFPSVNIPLNSTNTLGKSLYQAEEDMNNMEWSVAKELTCLENVRWWHRNIVKRGFRINGYMNHYPDIIIMTHGDVSFL